MDELGGGGGRVVGGVGVLLGKVVKLIFVGNT